MIVVAGLALALLAAVTRLAAGPTAGWVPPCGLLVTIFLARHAAAPTFVVVGVVLGLIDGLFVSTNWLTAPALVVVAGTVAWWTRGVFAARGPVDDGVVAVAAVLVARLLPATFGPGGAAPTAASCALAAIIAMALAWFAQRNRGWRHALDRRAR